MKAGSTRALHIQPGGGPCGNMLDSLYSYVVQALRDDPLMVCVCNTGQPRQRAVLTPC